MKKQTSLRLTPPKGIKYQIPSTDEAKLRYKERREAVKRRVKLITSILPRTSIEIPILVYTHQEIRHALEVVRKCYSYTRKYVHILSEGVNYIWRVY